MFFGVPEHVGRDYCLCLGSDDDDPGTPPVFHFVGLRRVEPNTLESSRIAVDVTRMHGDQFAGSASGQTLESDHVAGDLVGDIRNRFLDVLIRDRHHGSVIRDVALAAFQSIQRLQCLMDLDRDQLA